MCGLPCSNKRGKLQNVKRGDGEMKDDRLKFYETEGLK